MAAHLRFCVVFDETLQQFFFLCFGVFSGDFEKGNCQRERQLYSLIFAALSRQSVQPHPLVFILQVKKGSVLKTEKNFFFQLHICPICLIPFQNSCFASPTFCNIPSVLCTVLKEQSFQSYKSLCWINTVNTEFVFKDLQYYWIIIVSLIG